MAEKGFTREQLARIITAATAAPSGDNCQPWRFSSADGGRTVEVELDATRDLSTYNVRQMASLTAVGASLENARLAASALFERELTWAPTGGAELPRESRLVALMKAGGKPARPPVGGLGEAIETRRTHRARFDGKPPTDEELRTLSAARNEIEDEYPGVRVKLFTEKADKEKLLRLVSLADPLLFEVAPFRRHLFAQLRWTKPGEPLPPDGMPVDTLGVGFMDRIALRLFSRDAVAATAAKLGAGKQFGAATLKLAKTASAFAVVLAAKPAVPDILWAGAAMERLWLTVVAAGLVAQPTTSPMIHTWRERLGDMGIYTARQAAKVKTIARELTELLGESAEAPPVMVFRIGHSKPFPYCCGRRPLNDIFSYKDGSA